MVQPVDPLNHQSQVTVPDRGTPTPFFLRQWQNLIGIVASLTAVVNDVAALITLGNGKIYIGNASNVATEVTPSGDWTITNTGVATIANDAVSNAKLAEMTAYSLKANLTGSTANPTDAVYTSFTTESAPASGDFVIGFDDGGVLKKYTLGSLPAGGSSPTGTSLPDEIMADSPTGYWKCNDSGSTLVDSSGHGYDMTVVGTPTMQSHYLVPTINEKYMRLPASGTHGGSITSALGATMPLTGDWTVEAICSLDNDTVNHFVMFSLGPTMGSDTEANNMQIYFYRDTTINGGPSVFWEHGAGVDDFTRWPFGTFGLPLFTPFHIVAVKDGTANTVTFYVGGIKQELAVAYTNEPTGGSGTVLARIGYDGTFACNNGVIGHVAVYLGSKLSDARIWAHAKAAGLAGIVGSAAN